MGNIRIIPNAPTGPPNSYSKLELGVGSAAALGAVPIVVTLAVAVQPFSPVTVTINVPAVLTTILEVVSPIPHKYVPVPVAVKVVLGVAQFNAKPLLFVIKSDGVVLSKLTATLAVAVQPLAVETVTM